MGDVVELDLGEVGRQAPVAAVHRSRWRLRLFLTSCVLAGGAVVVAFDAPPASELARVPTRGSLARDEAVLSVLRDRAADVVLTQGGRRWRGDWRARADVVLAGDVAGSRVALVEVTQRSGLSRRREQVWFTGPAGGDVARLRQVAAQPAAGSAVALLPRGGADGGTLAVVVGTSATRVGVQGGAWVNADATVDWLPARAPQVGRWLWALDVDDAGGARILSVDGVDRVVVPTGSWSGVSPGNVLALVGRRPRRCCTASGNATPTVPDRARVLASLAAAQRASGSAATGALRFLQWSGELGGLPVDVVSVAAPTGGQVLTAHEAGGTRTWTTTLRALQPESLVFQLSPDDSGDPWVGLVGPAAATAAEVITVDRQGLLVPLAAGVGAVRARLRTDLDVTFLGADGRTLSHGRPIDAGAGGPVAAASP